MDLLGWCFGHLLYCWLNFFLYFSILHIDFWRIYYEKSDSLWVLETFSSETCQLWMSSIPDVLENHLMTIMSTKDAFSIKHITEKCVLIKLFTMKIIVFYRIYLKNQIYVDKVEQIWRFFSLLSSIWMLRIFFGKGSVYAL